MQHFLSSSQGNRAGLRRPFWMYVQQTDRSGSSQLQVWSCVIFKYMYICSRTFFKVSTFNRENLLVDHEECIIITVGHKQKTGFLVGPYGMNVFLVGLLSTFCGLKWWLGLGIQYFWLISCNMHVDLEFTLVLTVFFVLGSGPGLWEILINRKLQWIDLNGRRSFILQLLTIRSKQRLD